MISLLTALFVSVVLAHASIGHAAPGDEGMDGTENVVGTLATLTLTTPNGGEAWSFDSRRRIEWTSAEVRGAVRLELSRDAGTTWTVIAASTDNDGAFNWTVTPPATNRARVRVCSIATPSLCDMSDRNFRIGAALITVVTPNGDEAWVFDTTRQIQWTSTGPVGSRVSVELSRDAGATWTPIFANILNDGAQNWLVTRPASNRARIRVCSITVPSVCDTSDRNFRLVPGAFTVVTPNGGESWDTGTTQRMVWRSSGAVGPTVNIDLSRDAEATWEPIFTSIGNDGAQNWLVTGPPTTDARIRICSVATASICDRSDASFTISDGSVRVLSPNGGETWPVGGTRSIQWTSSVPGNVRVEVSRDGNVSWTTIFTSIENDGAVNWTVTGPGTTQARIRVCSVALPARCDTSNADFAISATADLTVRLLSFTPTVILGGTSWQVRVQTANDGVVAAEASRTDIFIGRTSATGTIRITGINVPALEPGEVADLRKTVEFPFTVSPGTYFVFARVDASELVLEGNEDNEFVLLDPTLLVN
jgi:CARDB protein